MPSCLSQFFSGGDIRTEAVSSTLNSYLLGTERICCTKQRNMSPSDPEKHFLSHSPASLFQAGLQLTEVSCSWGANIWSRPGAGKHRQEQCIRCSQTSDAVPQSLNGSVVTWQGANGSGPSRRWVWTYGVWLTSNKGGRAHKLGIDTVNLHTAPGHQQKSCKVSSEIWVFLPNTVLDLALPPS